jgi:hypothetical protein
VLALGLAVLRAYEARFQPQVEAPDPYLVPFHGAARINSWLLQVAAFYDSGGQRLAHVVMSAVLALLFVFPWGTSVEGRIGQGAKRGLILLGAFAVLAFAGWRTRWPDLAAGAAAVAGLAVLARRLRTRLVEWTGAVLVVVVLLGVTVPGFRVRLDLAKRPSTPAWIEWHYGSVLGPADLLGGGWRIGDVPTSYGLLPPVLLAGYQRFRGVALEMGDYVRAIQISQVLLLVVCAVLYHRHARGAWALTLVAILLLVPWYHSTQPGIYFPNQTPLRMIGVPLAAATVMAVRRLPASRSAPFLGVLAAVALFLNVECGLAVSAGVAAFLWQRRDPGLGKAPLAVRAGLGALAGLALVAALCRTLLGTWLRPRDVASMAETVRLVAKSGLSGSPFALDPLALLMFGHAAILLLLLARAGNGPSAAFRAFLAATLVAWFAYYANRPTDWSLAGFHVLYAFLAIDLLRGIAASLAGRRLSAATTLAAAAIGGVLLPTTVWRYRSWAVEWLPAGWVEAARGDHALVSGVLFERPWADELSRRAAALRRSAAAGRAAYFSSDSYLLSKLSGVLPPWPYVDIINATLTRSHYDRLLSGIVEQGVATLYFDPPESQTDRESPYRGLFQMIRRDLASDYLRAGVEEGWEVWRRIPNDVVPLRGEAPRGGEPLRVLVAGGRTAESAGAGPGRSWTERLAARLERRWTGAWVGNAGREGQDTRALSKLLPRGGGSFHPQVVVFLVGSEDIGILDPVVTEARFDILDEPLRIRPPKGHRARHLAWCRETIVPGYRTRLRELVQAWQAIGADPLLITQPALFGPGVDRATGVDLAALIVSADAGLLGRLAWEMLELTNQSTREVAAETRVPIVDLATSLPKDSRLFDGLLAFSDAGAEEVSRQVEEALRRQLDRRGPSR